MDASLLEVLIIAWCAVALNITCGKVTRFMAPQSPDQIKAAMMVRAMIGGMPAWLHPFFQLGMCLGVLLLVLATWPYGVIRELWDASDVALSDQDLHNMLNAHQAYRTSLDNAFAVEEKPKSPSTDETQKMPALPDPFKVPPKDGPG